MRSGNRHADEHLSEQVDLLKCRVLNSFNGKSAGPLVLAFTSCEPGEGVSSVAVSLATELARDPDRSVLLIDCDLRRPSLQDIFLPEPEGNGSAEVLPISRELEPSQPAWKIHQAAENLDVLLARQRIEQPGAIFGRREWDKFLTRSKEKYDFIIADCPPVNRSSGSAVVTAKADGVILVVEAERLRREVVQRSMAILEDTGANVLGVVLNKRKYPIPGMFYKYL